MINMVVGLLFFVLIAGGGWLITTRALGLTVKGEPRLRNVRHQLWHPDSPGARVLVRPGPLRRMGLVRSDFATSTEMRRYHRDHRNNLMAVGSPSRAFNARDPSAPKADAERVRELEHEMGIGPFFGRESYCDLTKCTSQNHTHDDVDKETMTGKAAPKPEPERPKSKVDPNTVRWSGPEMLERAEELAREGRMPSYCMGDHDHTEIRSLQGTVRRVCDRRQGHRGPPPTPRPSFAKLYEANLEKVRRGAMPPVVMGERIGDTSITYHSSAAEADRTMKLISAGIITGESRPFWGIP